MPEDVAIVGFDNWDVMALASRPPLTTVDPNLAELGRLAARKLLAAIEGGADEHGRICMPCDLVIRQSTGAHRRPARISLAYDGAGSAMACAPDGGHHRGMQQTSTMTRRIGALTVSGLGFGCWAIGGPFGREGAAAGWGDVDDDESVAAIRRALELGVTFFDTADVYGTGHSERVLAPGAGRATATGSRSRRSSATRSRTGTGRMTGTDASPGVHPPRAGRVAAPPAHRPRRALPVPPRRPRARAGRRGRRDARGAARRGPDPRLRLEPRRRRARRAVGRPRRLRGDPAPPQRARGRAGDARAVRARTGWRASTAPRSRWAC